MSDVFILPCPCGGHDFVFGEKPNGAARVKCPVCGKETTYDPSEKPKKLEEEKINGIKAKQEQ